MKIKTGKKYTRGNDFFTKIITLGAITVSRRWQKLLHSLPYYRVCTVYNVHTYRLQTCIISVCSTWIGVLKAESYSGCDGSGMSVYTLPRHRTSNLLGSIVLTASIENWHLPAKSLVFHLKISFAFSDSHLRKCTALFLFLFHLRFFLFKRWKFKPNIRWVRITKMKFT